MPYFIGLDLNEQIREHLADLQNKSKDGFKEVSWLAKDQLYVVLRFLGELSEASKQPIRKALGLVVGEVASFDFSLTTADCFPATDPPRSLWVGIKDHNDMLWRLSKGCEAQLAFHQTGADTRSVIPHIVLGRVPGKSVQGNLRRHALGLRVEPLVQKASEVLLVESQSNKKGTEYVVRQRYPFGATVV